MWMRLNCAICSMRSRDEIFEQWRYRYAPGVTENVASVCAVRAGYECRLFASRRASMAFPHWLPFDQAADLVFFWNKCGCDSAFGCGAV